MKIKYLLLMLVSGSEFFVTVVMLFGLGISSQVFSQVSIELEEACRDDVDLTEYIVNVIENGSTTSDYVSSDEATQISLILEDEQNAGLSASDKLAAILVACSEGRILQDRHSHIINAQ